jgi:hypothetical protein
MNDRDIGTAWMRGEEVEALAAGAKDDLRSNDNKSRGVC